MLRSLQTDSLIKPFSGLIKASCPQVQEVALLGPDDESPATTVDQLLLPLRNHAGTTMGTLVLRVAHGTDRETCLQQIAPAIECLSQTMAAARRSFLDNDHRLLKLAIEMDLDFTDDSRLDKAVSAVARRLGVEVAWLAAPRSHLTVAVRGSDHDIDPAVRTELGQMKNRLKPLTGKLRHPLIINGRTPGSEHAASCRLLLTPLFVGRARHNVWLALANPLSAPPFGGWHMLAAMTMGQALARRLEVDLDRRTGLFNRGGLEAAMGRLKCKRASLMLLDIDRLQSINQLHGMAAGDAAIMAMAHVLMSSSVPPNALVARTMGDQFAILLPERDTTEASEIAVAVQSRAARIQPGMPDDPSPMSLTIGIVAVDDTSKPFDRFAIDADTALKLAKDRGRSRIEVYDSSSSTLIRRNDEVLAAADLREALRTGELLLFAQPIRLLSDRSAAPSFELLVRMRDEFGEIISPGEFIAAAQRFQLMKDLDRYVVDAALAAIAPHRALLSRQSSSVSINVSGQSLSSDAFIDHVISRLRELHLPGSLITIEVTEQEAVTNLERAAVAMRRLRDIGCGIAIDDFGTGANSLAYLRSLPVTRIKIDGSFVRDLVTNGRSEAGVKGIAQLAREFDLDIVAEYVESEVIARRLQTMGVHRGQGYLFGRPEPVELALEKLREEEDAQLKQIYLHS